MRFGKILAGIGIGAILLGAVQASAQAPAAATGVVGTWVNPRGSVKVQTGACGDKLCGWVVWANDEAQTTQPHSLSPHAPVCSRTITRPATANGRAGSMCPTWARPIIRRSSSRGRTA